MGVPPVPYDDVAAAYRGAVDPGHGEALRDPILEALLGDVCGRRVLALACGSGRDARLLADLGASVVGVDVSRGLLAYAREFERQNPRGIDYVLGDAQTLDEFDTATFDGVVCNMALMDIPELGPAVRAVRRVLRDGGFFMASIVHPCYAPHVDAVHGYLVDGRYDKIDGPDWLPPHAYHRSLSSYINTLSNAGLLIIQVAEPPDEHATGVPNLLYFSCRATDGSSTWPAAAQDSRRAF